MIPRFFNDLHYGEMADGVRIRLDAPLHYYSPILERITDGHVYVEVGFVCDLTSLRLLGLVSRGPWNRAAAIHDKLYKHPYFTDGKGKRRRLTKRQCDLVFREAMKCLHTHWFRTELYYGGVLLFAHKAWLGHRLRDWRENRKPAPKSYTNLP